MAEHYWAQVKSGEDPLAAELETMLYGYVGQMLQKWQKKALKRAIKAAKREATKRNAS